ncbi:hypothetical protein [Streptomyces chartreusis]|uniref:hypothetical protein n=1 Tax=Streptomyces chartreusis TaxID=1969 RepID=UPI002E81EAF4|nr:hypothetical protein [Streptomyces chartreusis]WUB23851.1 hypothetical protein OG997_44825 [Streptomyces chartreusis]
MVVGRGGEQLGEGEVIDTAAGGAVRCRRGVRPCGGPAPVVQPVADLGGEQRRVRLGVERGSDACEEGVDVVALGVVEVGRPGLGVLGGGAVRVLAGVHQEVCGGVGGSFVVGGGRIGSHDQERHSSVAAEVGAPAAPGQFGDEQGADYFSEPYTAHPEPFNPSCGCGVCDLVIGPGEVVALSNGDPWDACNPWPADDHLLIVPAQKRPARPVEE